MPGNSDDFAIPVLGPCTIQSPLSLSEVMGDLIPNFVEEDERVLLNAVVRDGRVDTSRSFELAGPRRNIYFDPPKTRAGIVTCGGLCPGINDVVKTLVNELYRYGIASVTGFTFGYAGLIPGGPSPVVLTPEVVSDWNLHGGSMLGSSRGPQDPAVMVDTLQRMSINILFAVGGDGTMRGARAIWEEATRRGYGLAVVGVPKTIDNDIPYITRTFGFETAVSRAAEAIRSALVEARGAPRGIGLVKLMGRYSGYIAAYASLAVGDVDLVLVPEVPFTLEGLFAQISDILERQGYCMIVAAEGAGQDLFPEDDIQYDASGNRKLKDIGLFLKERIVARFTEEKSINLKHIDPGYIIRAAVPTPNDAVFCHELGEYAVHAAMAGRTGLVVGYWNDHFTHVPLVSATSRRKIIDPDGALWRSVLQMSGQPATF